MCLVYHHFLYLQDGNYCSSSIYLYLLGHLCWCYQFRGSWGKYSYFVVVVAVVVVAVVADDLTFLLYLAYPSFEIVG